MGTDRLSLTQCLALARSGVCSRAELSTRAHLSLLSPSSSSLLSLSPSSSPLLNHLVYSISPRGRADCAMAFQIPDHGGSTTQGFTYRPLPPTNNLNSPGTSYDNGYANTIATPSSPARSSTTGGRSYLPTSPNLSASGRLHTNEYDLSPPPTQHSRHNSRYPLMHSSSGGGSDDGGAAAAAAGAGAGGAARPEDEVVEIQARKIAPVNEKGERTLHRALDANQVRYFFSFFSCLFSPFCSSFGRTYVPAFLSTVRPSAYFPTSDVPA